MRKVTSILIVICLILSVIGCFGGIKTVLPSDVRVQPEKLFVLTEQSSNVKVIEPKTEKGVMGSAIGYRDTNRPDLSVSWSEYYDQRRRACQWAMSEGALISFDISSIPQKSKVKQAKMYLYILTYITNTIEGKKVKFDQDLDKISYTVGDKSISTPEYKLKDSWLEVDLTKEVQDEMTKLHPSDFAVTMEVPSNLRKCNVYYDTNIATSRMGKHVMPRLLIEY